MSEERERDDSSKELSIGFFNPLAAPFLRHDPGEEVEEIMEEEEQQQVEEEEFNSIEEGTTSFEDLTENEKKEYLRFLQDQYDDQLREEQEEEREIKDALFEKDKEEYLKELETRKKELMMKVTLDCMKKCLYFKTHPYIPRGIVLFEKEQKCIKRCARKSFGVLNLINQLNEKGDINFNEMVAREFGVSDDL